MALTTNQRRAIVNGLVANCGCKNERQVFNALSDRALYNLYRSFTQNEGADMGEEDLYWEGNDDPTANEDEYELDAAGNPILDESGQPKKKVAAANEGEEFPEEEFSENEGEEGMDISEEDLMGNEGEEMDEEDEFMENSEDVMGDGSETILAGQEGLQNPPSANRRFARNRRRVMNAAQQEALYLQQAPPRVREMLNNAMAFDQQRKNECIRIITANANNMFTKEFLRTKTLKELRALANLANNGAVNNSAPQMLMPNYAGQAPVPTANGAAFNPNDDLLPLPTTNFAAKPGVKKRRRLG